MAEFSFLDYLRDKEADKYEQIKGNLIRFDVVPAGGYYDDTVKSRYVLQVGSQQICGTSSLEKSKLEQQLEREAVRLRQQGFFVRLGWQQRRHSVRRIGL